MSHHRRHRRGAGADRPSPSSTSQNCFTLTVLAFVVVVAAINGYAYVLEVWRLSLAADRYPLLLDPRAEGDHRRRYHATDELVWAVLERNTLNPFMTPIELSDGDGDDKHLIAYGPATTTEDDDGGGGGDRPTGIDVVVVCGQHARELISPELCYHLVSLLQLQERDPGLTTRLGFLQERGVRFWVLPVANAEGRLHVERDPDANGCQRRTVPSQVDLNRNFPLPAAADDRTRRRHRQIDRNDVTYPGPSPLSEPETRMTVALFDLVGRRPDVVLNVHSGSRDILLPFDYTSEALPPNYSTMVRVANLARRRSCPQCRVNPASLTLYEATGTLTDWAITHRGARFAYTLEIYQSPDADPTVGDDRITPEQCRRWFNPTEGEEYADVVHRWLHFIVDVVELVEERSRGGGGGGDGAVA